MATTAIDQRARGQPPAKRIRRETVRLQEGLHTLCARYRDGDVYTWPRSCAVIGHKIRLS